MFKDTIPGLERIFTTDTESPKVVLVTGPPGSLKTSFCYDIMTKYLEETGNSGLYVTLEEPKKSQVKNMKDIGVDLVDELQISDITDLREIDQIVDEEGTDYVEFIEDILRHRKDEKGDQFTIFALDSLGALYSLMENRENMRKRMFSFFNFLRELNLYCFIVMERTQGSEANLLGDEGFLVDGLISLSIDRKKGKLTRYLQVEKMRACNHTMEKHALEVGKDGLKVLGPLFE
ncbi:MAG: signal transduction protein [Candidatus Thermoplasmatota archaeon]|nr:signal transduction protein [Candidatus Thermoplasmatota archaeon]